jgi:molybdopterin molybdotransferase
MLVALAVRSGAQAGPATRLPDEAAATREGLTQALEGAEVVVVSGGVSVGPHDHVKPALASLGVDERFWGVALQPGKPTWFGTRADRLVFGLPGNPVSAAVTFTLFVAPALAALQGAAEPLPRRLTAALSTEVRRSPQREQALRVRIEPRDRVPVAVLNGPQGSHHTTSLVGAHGLAMIPIGQGPLGAGSPVEVEPL